AKIAGFIDKRQFKEFLNTETAQLPEKIVLGFCRKKDLGKLKKQNLFYFHAVKNESKILDFQTGIHSSKKLFIYSGGRSKPIELSSLYREIKAITLKHKSTIKGKENSKTDFYYEIELYYPFTEKEEYKFALDTRNLFEKSEIKTKKLFQQYLPVLTTI